MLPLLGVSMNIVVTVPAGCGEILQGNMDKRSLIVACPVNLYVTARVVDGIFDELAVPEKSRRAVAATLRYLGEKSFPYALGLSSDVPQGKGMSSSSADIGAVIAAVSAAFGYEMTEKEICSLALAIEPTDPVFCEGIAAMDRKSGEIIHTFTSVPPMSVLTFDRGGVVDTVSFYKDKDEDPDGSQDLKELYSALKKAGDDCRVWGAVATASARANQKIFYKPELETLIHLAEQYDVCGVGTAHTGTLYTVFMPSEKIFSAGAELVRAIKRTLPGLQYKGVYTLIAGGVSKRGR